MKIRQNLYLDREVMVALDALARRPGGNKSRIVNDMLQAALARQASGELEATFKARLDRMTREIRAGNRVGKVLLEAHMLFVRHMFDVLPAMPQGDAAAAAKAAGALRFERFIDELGRELAKDAALPVALPAGEAGQ
jgi:hypothetical protein